MRILSAAFLLSLLWACSSSQVSSVPVDPARARRMMDWATRIVEAGPAAQGHPSKARVQALIQREIRSFGLEVHQHPFTVVMPELGMRWDLVNLRVSFRPEAKHRVLVGCHWDIRPWADEDPDPARRNQPFDGANDGVSGVVVLLELARELAAAPPPEGVGVDIVFFDGEEGPKDSPYHYLGSKDLAGHWAKTGVAEPARGLIVDMVGRKGLRIRREGFSQRSARAVLDEVFAIARKRGARHFEDAPGKHVLDDHIAFLQRGIPVANLIDIDDPHWHTHEDRLEHLDPEAMAEVAEVVIAWVRAQRAPGS
ncbi:MAG TPA: M28 family peptidase [Fredinandcohnia sp.]|nr:M28 family peptidase [Fredinandcohnia sp.]